MLKVLKKNNDDNTAEENSTNSHQNKSSSRKMKKNNEKTDDDSNTTFPRMNTCKCGHEYIQTFLKCTMCIACFEILNHFKDEFYNRTRNITNEQQKNDVHKRPKINVVISSAALSNPVEITTDDFPEEEEEVIFDDTDCFDDFLRIQERRDAISVSPIRIKKVGDVDKVQTKKKVKNHKHRIGLRQMKISK
jgi:hypothetical protein